jgi:sulfur carrier protein
LSSSDPAAARAEHDSMVYIQSMRLQINGDEQEFADTLTLADLIAQLGMKTDRVAVELNREIVSRTQWAETALHDGDKLEIVHFVGGG